MSRKYVVPFIFPLRPAFTPNSPLRASSRADTAGFTEQTTKDAIKFYNGKVEDLGKNLGELEKVIAGKSDNVRIVEDGELLVGGEFHNLKGFWVPVQRDSLTLPAVSSVAAESHAGRIGHWWWSRGRRIERNIVRSMRKMRVGEAFGLFSLQATYVPLSAVCL